VYNLALSYVQNNEEAEEITQDVFVAIHFALEKFEHKSEMSTWIYRITINKSIDFIRFKNRKKRVDRILSIFYPNSTELKHDGTDFNHPGVVMEQKEATQLLFAQINELPDNQRTALILNKIEQKSLAEIATIMNLSHKAVESLIQRAKTKLVKKNQP
jgi:RNA polymerase sigma-70 factor (ECF subfamily)